MRTATTRTRQLGHHPMRRVALVIGLLASVAVGTVAVAALDSGNPATPTARPAPNASEATVAGSSGLDSIGAKRREQYAAMLGKTAIIATTDTRTPRPGFPTDRPVTP